jgi:hypothetical protein
MRTPTLLAAAGAIALTLGCGLLDAGGNNTDTNDGGGAPPPPAKTTDAVPGKPTPTKTERTGAPAKPARLVGCTTARQGGSCEMQGSGFGYNELVTYWDTKYPSAKSTVYADDNGAWTADYGRYSSPGTVITVRAEGATSGRHAEFSFTLTAD